MERRNTPIHGMLGGVVQRAPASPMYGKTPVESAMDYFRRTGMPRPISGGADDEQHFDQLPEEVRTALGTIGELSDEDLDAREAELEALARNEETPIEAVEQAVEAVTAIQQERGRREEAAQAEQTRREEALARLTPEASSDDGTDGDGTDGDGTDEGNGDEGDGTDADNGEGTETPAPGTETQVETPAGTEVTETAPPAEPEGVAASGRRVARRPSPGAMNRNRPASQGARPSGESARTRIVDLRNLSELDSLSAAAERIIRVANGMGQGGADGDRIPVLSLRSEVPSDRRIADPGDATANGAILAAISTPEAITAAGGLCAPSTVDYDIPNISDASRPVRDDLPQAGTAVRGGIRFAKPGNFTDLNGAARIWTMDDDTDALDLTTNPTAVKPCMRVECADFDEVFIRAIPVCLTFGNIGARAYPEQVADALRSVMAVQARLAESELLYDIGQAGDTVTAGTEVSATRDILGAVGRAVAHYRYVHRTAPNFPLRANLPQWLRDLIRTDLANELPGSTQERLAVADSQIDTFFAARSIRTTWRMDEERGYTSGKPFYGEQADGAPLIEFPTSARIYLSHEGAFSFISMPELDLGLVRDSALNSTNDYQIFAETFEAVAHRGFQALNLDVELCPSGATVGAVDYTCPSGS